MNVIYFTAKWCAPCKQLLPRIMDMAQARGLSLDVVDIEERPQLAREHGIMSVPTVVAGGRVLSGDAVVPRTLARLLDEVQR